MFSAAEDARTDQYEQESAQIERESQVEGILKRLDERERQIVTSRFGLTRGQEPLTLKQVGAAMGVTKERVRQIQSRAMNKLEKLPRRTASNNPVASALEKWCSDERKKTARTRTSPRHSLVANRRRIGLAREPRPPPG